MLPSEVLIGLFVGTDHELTVCARGLDFFVQQRQLVLEAAQRAVDPCGSKVTGDICVTPSAVRAKEATSPPTMTPSAPAGTVGPEISFNSM